MHNFLPPTCHPSFLLLFLLHTHSYSRLFAQIVEGGFAFELGCGLGWGGYLRVSITSRDVLAKDSAGHKFGAAVKADAHVQSVGGVIVIELIVYIARHGVYWKRFLGSSVVL
jgi:hypothetical protein